MNNIMLLFTMLLYVTWVIPASYAQQSKPLFRIERENAQGLPVYIQIFKEERVLELYVQQQNRFHLLKQYRICEFSGGLGPKRQQGDLKSPEGFYQATRSALNPNSRFYKSINLGYPNQYDQTHGYSGDHLMIHGECESTGCYAMTNDYIEEIYSFVKAALNNGQSSVPIAIYPFVMTEKNMQRHRSSAHLAFWQQLKPGYDYFIKHRQPPSVEVTDGRYVINQALFLNHKQSQTAAK